MKLHETHAEQMINTVLDDVLEVVLHQHGSDTGQTDVTHLALDLVEVQGEGRDPEPFDISVLCYL